MSARDAIASLLLGAGAGLLMVAVIGIVFWLVYW